jgi:outer membrane receptor for ferrienterochelin and colicins
MICRERITKGAGAGRFLAFVLVVAASLPVGAKAQEGCETSLKLASGWFDQGRFDDARTAIEECLADEPRRAEKIQAYSLLAKIHLALDDRASAESALNRLLDLDPEFEPDLFDSPRFVRLVEEAKSRKQTPVVTSVSKSKESLLEAPATVIVVTAEEIERRGYLDLEAVLHDLPGFDFSKRAGAVYANIYQRGYRSIETNRTLLLIDGVEDNDLASSTAWISRQFAMSNIDRIEVVYGPASTMYGANAFAGVINVITKEPKAIIADDSRLGFDAWLTGGSWSTSSLDGTVAGESGSGSLSWSLSGRRYQSDDFNHLQNYEQWDYDPAFYDTVNYQGMSSLNVTDPAAVQAILNKYSLEQISPYFDVVTNEQGEAVALNLTAAGGERARAFDQAAFTELVGGYPVEFSLPVNDWQLYGKLQTSNLVIGMQFWRRKEASHVPLVDTFAATGRNGFLWTPEHTFLYVKYFRRFLEDKLSFTSFTRYKKHELDGTDSANIFLSDYHLGGLGVEDLIEGNKPFWPTTYNYRSNNQLRTEVNVFYDHSETFNLVSGLELRFSSIGAKNIASSTPPAGETGSVSGEIAGGNQISSRDIGAYAQASLRPWAPLKLVAGARLDNNKIRDTGGYGDVFNMRLAGVYSWRDFIFKAIYSEAFQDAPNFQRFETVPGVRELDNPNLAPEEVNNFELSAGWSPGSDVTLQMVTYWASYKGIVEEVSGVPCPEDLDCTTTNQFQNVGKLDIQGVQAEAKWTPGPYELLGNYTYSDPFDPDRGVRVGDIASHRLNVLGGTTYRDRLDLSLRLNCVVGRKTGQGTTVDRNPFDKIGNYAVVHFTASYRSILPGLDLQFAINNLFDSEYFDPSLRNPSGFPIAARIPQPVRIFFVSLRVSR